MIGRIDPAHREVTIVGAGVAGLLAAYQLDKKGYRVTLLEAEKRAGGLIRTVQTELGMAESAAHSVLAASAFAELCQELRVELIPVRKGSKARFVWRAGKMRKVPFGVLGIGEIFRAMIRAYFVLAERSPSQGQTLESWAKRHLGQRVLDYLIGPFVRGIYAARPSELGVKAAFPALQIPVGHSVLSYFLAKKITRRGRFQRPASGAAKARRPRMMAPRNGMGALIQALERHLESRLGERFKKGVKVSEIPQAPNVVLAVPAYVAADLLRAADPTLGQALAEVSYTPLVSTAVFVRNEAFTRPVRGVGVLIPEVEKRKCLGILFDSSSFENRVKDETKYSAFTVMLGGSAQAQWAEASDSEIVDAVNEELRAILGMRGSAEQIEIFRWKRAIPKYSPELERTWELARASWCSEPGRVLFGNYTGQVSLRGMAELARELANGL